MKHDDLPDRWKLKAIDWLYLYWTGYLSRPNVYDHRVTKYYPPTSTFQTSETG
jgi:hypothetical protein